MSIERPRLEGLSVPSIEISERIEARGPITENRIEPTEEGGISKKEESTAVEDSLRLEQIREELRKGTPEIKKDGEENSAEQKLKSREMKEKIEKNDIIVGERHIELAKDLLGKAGIEFEVKRFAEEEQVPNSEAILPGEFIFRLHKNDDESAHKAFAILRQAKLECKIIEDVVSLDEQSES